MIHRPVLHTVVRRAVADNDALLAQWDQRWRTQPSFRRHIVLMSTVLGGVLLTESTVRLALIYLLPIDAVAGWSTALHLGTVVLLVCWALWYRDRRRRAMAADRLRTQAEPQRLRGQ